MAEAVELNDPDEGALRVIALGGLGEIGRNMMVFETSEDMVVVDVGLMFPGDDLHGVDYIIPNADYVVERREKLRAILITHGHEDHIGALRFLWPQLRAPIYSAPLTLALISHRFEESGILDAPMHNVSPGACFEFGSISAEFFPVAHSIPDSYGIALRTPAGIVVHTGDFKIDHTPVLSMQTDLQRLADFGREGVRLLCSDSTYADKPGATPTEQVVGEALEQILLTAPGRVIIATFASQIARIQQIIDAAEESDRVVFAAGFSMVRNLEISRDLGYVEADDHRLRPVSDLGSARDENTVIICTGAQGEARSALARMASGSHQDVTLERGRHGGDLVIADPGQRVGSLCDDEQPVSAGRRRDLGGVGTHRRARARSCGAGGVEDGARADQAAGVRADPGRVSPSGAARSAG